jgi:hypothetical protein
MPELRVLHLRQNNCEYLHGDGCDNLEAYYGHETFASYVQDWANTFFDYLQVRGWSPNLLAIVVYSSVEQKTIHATNMDLHEEHREGEHKFTPQLCFIKGHQVDVLGGSAAVAVPVSRAKLLERVPEAFILNLDPGCNWVGGRDYLCVPC